MWACDDGVVLWGHMGEAEKKIKKYFPYGIWLSRRLFILVVVIPKSVFYSDCRSADSFGCSPLGTGCLVVVWLVLSG